MGKVSARRKKKQSKTKAKIADVEAFLDEERKESAIFGAPLSRVADKDLFYQGKEYQEHVLPKTKKQAIREAPLRSLSVLASNPKIKPLSTIKRKKRIDPFEVLRSQTKKPLRPSKMPPQPNGGVYDIWETEEKPRVPAGIALDFVEPTLKKPVKVPKTKLIPPLAHPSAPSSGIPVPDTTTSYNPDYESHQDALGVALAKEVRDIDQRKLLREKICPSDVVVTTLADGTDADEQDEDTTEQVASTAPVPDATKKLTKAERNKQLRRKQDEEATRRKVIEAQMAKDLKRLPELLKEVDDLDASNATQRRRPAKVPRLGKLRYEDAAPEVLLSDELPSSLRSLKGSTTLLRDGYKLMQKKGVIEPRVPVSKRKQIRKLSRPQPVL